MGSRLSGKTAFVTAAAAGIGRASALAFASEGARVTATDINEQGLSELAGIDGIETRPLDVTDPAAIEAAAREAATPDVLFNCAGFVHHGSVLSTGEDEWRFSIGDQRGRHVPHDPGVPSRHDRAGRRLGNQHVVRRLVYPGAARPLRLRHHQGGP